MPLEYSGQVSSALVNGDVKLLVEEDGLTLLTPFDTYHIPYVDVNVLACDNYAVRITTKTDTFAILRLGNACMPFYDALYAAYNSKVRKALFVTGTPLLQVQGAYHYIENGKVTQGNAVIEVYENCVLILPPDTGARRVPLCFVTSMEKGDFTLTLRLNTAESYTFAKLGYDTAPFEDVLVKQLHILRQNALDYVKLLDPSLSSAQASAIAKLIPEGVAASMGTLAQISPSFVNAFEGEIQKSRSKEYYAVLKEICNPEEICVGMKKGFGRREKQDVLSEDVAADDAASLPDSDEKDETILWMIAPNQKGNTAVVEFAVAEKASAATFVYRFGGSFAAFATALNRAVEAIDFHREVIRLSDAELQTPEYATYQMAIRRNISLQFIRSCFAGRVIHSSWESWKQMILAYLQ